MSDKNIHSIPIPCKYLHHFQTCSFLLKKKLVFSIIYMLIVLIVNAYVIDQHEFIIFVCCYYY